MCRVLAAQLTCDRIQHCCRPGETILLESTAGDAPHVVSNVLINWPLHIVGGGATATDTVIEVHFSHTRANRHMHTKWALDAHISLLHPLLNPWDSLVVLSKLQCGVGASAALDFRCSGKVANVTVRAARAACVRHQQGSLWVSVALTGTAPCAESTMLPLRGVRDVCSQNALRRNGTWGTGMPIGM